LPSFLRGSKGREEVRPSAAAPHSDLSIIPAEKKRRKKSWDAAKRAARFSLNWSCERRGGEERNPVYLVFAIRRRAEEGKGEVIDATSVFNDSRA